MRNWLTFDGVSTKDFGVYISGGGTYNAPARSREVISVPGRNGDLIIDNGRYENTEVVYHAFIYRNFGVNVEGLRNLLLSKTGSVSNSFAIVRTKPEPAPSIVIFKFFIFHTFCLCWL